jgi:hypothetical protein
MNVIGSSETSFSYELHCPMSQKKVFRSCRLRRYVPPKRRSIRTTLRYILEDISILQMEVIRSSETSVHVRATLCCFPDDDSIRNYRYEKLKCKVGCSVVADRSTARHVRAASKVGCSVVADRSTSRHVRAASVTVTSLRCTWPAMMRKVTHTSKAESSRSSH